MDARTKILHDALARIGRPNREIKPTAQDALDMAGFARDELRRYDETDVRDHRVFVDDRRCTLVRLWTSGEVEVAHRGEPGHTWGPPTSLHEEI